MGGALEVHRELLTKKSNAVFAVHFTVKGVLTSCTLLIRRSASVLKVDVPVGCED